VLEYGFHADSEEVYVLEYNQLVTEILWPVLFVLFAEHPDRLGFLEDLLSVRFSKSEKEQFQSADFLTVIDKGLIASKNHPFQELFEKYQRNVTNFQA
jgi:hypothetical protein